ncbi:hypothetical protein BGZ96_010126 [Linnemannia gamsii]|uniref:Uncharacterized protein n=1 Tax=Linnemannia gamsii TaxID=64522 RepID=A0ABQ7JVB9_9FUNG|nr:hypothetical protein BGZ96_010126 [Linnemannia gamsii]
MDALATATTEAYAGDDYDIGQDEEPSKLETVDMWNQNNSGHKAQKKSNAVLTQDRDDNGTDIEWIIKSVRLQGRVLAGAAKFEDDDDGPSSGDNEDDVRCGDDRAIDYVVDDSFGSADNACGGGGQ